MLCAWDVPPQRITRKRNVFNARIKRQISVFSFETGCGIEIMPSVKFFFILLETTPPSIGAPGKADLLYPYYFW